MKFLKKLKRMSIKKQSQSQPQISEKHSQELTNSQVQIYCDIIAKRDTPFYFADSRDIETPDYHEIMCVLNLY